MRTNGPDKGDSLYFQHIGVLACGFIMGMFATYFLASLPLDFSKNLVEARKLGIVSLTTLKGYPKARDTFNFLLTISMPVLFAVGGWLVFIRNEKRHALTEFLVQNKDYLPKTKAWVYCLISVTAVYLVLSFNINILFKPNYYPGSGYWPFLGEEGTTLAWVQSLLSGGIFSKDFSSAYGPMLLYPLTLFMKFFGATVLTQRIYTVVLNMIAYGIVIAFLYKTINSKTIFVVASLIYFLIFPPFLYVSPNTTHLRVALGFFPVLLSYLYFYKRNAGILLLVGILAGQSLLFSQEVGICSVIAVLLFLVLRDVSEGSLRAFPRAALLFAAGCIISVAPFILYFSAKGVLGAFLDEMYHYPKLFALGYSAMPFPDFRSFVANPLKEGLSLHYWVLLIYIFTAIYLIPLFLMGKFTPRNILKSSLLVFGIFLFRGALCRSDEYHVLFASQPAFILFFLFLDSAFVMFFDANQMMRRINLFLAAVLVVSFGLVVTHSSEIINARYRSLKLFGLSMEDNTTNITAEQKAFGLFEALPKWSHKATGYQAYGVERARGIYFGQEFADKVMKIDAFLKANTTQEDYVYFFPNEAAYYFLFNRKNPTRYAAAYQAITAEQRQEIVRDLEAKKPEYVIYSRATWRIDNIPETIQVPEVVDYLVNNYQLVEAYSDILLLKKKELYVRE
jgi:hypothetical protein